MIWQWQPVCTSPWHVSIVVVHEHGVATLDVCEHFLFAIWVGLPDMRHHGSLLDVPSVYAAASCR